MVVLNDTTTSGDTKRKQIWLIF